jgi:antitoxin component HigA of HigAB toxin-antitoxin module
MQEIVSEKMCDAMLMEAEMLVDLDPMPRTEEGDRLDQVAWLLEGYEERKYRLQYVD